MSKLAQNDHEDDEAGDPRPEFVLVHNLVPEEGNEEGTGGDDDNTSPARHIVVHSMDQLRTDNDIDRRPADASQHIEDGNELDAVVTKEIPRQNHLPQAEARPEGAEEADRGYAKQIDEEDGEQSVNEAELEDGNRQSPNRERRDHHIG